MVSAADFYATARSKIGLNFQDGRLDDTNIVGAVGAINAGLMELCLDHDWDFLYNEVSITTAADVATYPMPNNYLRTLWLSDGQGHELSQRQRRNAVRYTQSGMPRFYDILDGKFFLSPTPNGVYTMQHGYYSHIPPVTATTISQMGAVELDIPALFQPYAALFVAKHICMMFKDYNAFKMVQDQLATEKRRLDDNVRRSLAPMSPQVRGDAWV